MRNTGEPGRPRYGYVGELPATADWYPADQVPGTFWRKIELIGPGMTAGGALVYLREPADPRELPDVMWKLQTSAARLKFRIVITDADGQVTEAPPVPTD